MQGQQASMAQTSTTSVPLICHYFHDLPSLSVLGRDSSMSISSPPLIFGPATFLYSLETQKH